ncbi:hypothetical protein PU560_13885 [Georgenia sp. 10Sc9-8]|uniref:Uncharacterized protein n=1 Tax=Georgenia halotolerans TaxID=3028317 RepID=A0ABT5TZP6_9MICO|nr:hypothetical protein [Georgenia halotolerans]
MSTENEGGKHSGGGCDPGGLPCRIVRFRRQSEVAEESEAALEGMQEKYDAARTAYTDARTRVRADTEAAREQLKRIHETLRCLLDDEDRACLKRAVETVLEEIDECTGPGGCRVGECTFDSSVGEDETVGSLAGRIAEYRRTTTHSTDVFNELIRHPEEVPTDLEGLRAQVEELDEAARAEDRGDVARLYAWLLVLWRKLDDTRLWRGFESVRAYMSCLCRAMECSYTGWEAVIILEGALAERICQEEAEQAECQKKHEDVLELVLAECDRTCRPGRGGTGKNPEQESPTQQEPPHEKEAYRESSELM